MVSPAFNWSGFYIGVNAGYAFNDDENIRTTGQTPGYVLNVTGGARPDSVRLQRDGFVGGGQIGYNWQTGPNFVFGVGADIAYTDFNRDRNVVTIPLSGARSLNNTFSSRMDYLGTVRGRLGYAIDRTLLYVTGGFAYGEIENTASFFGPAVSCSSLARP